MWPDWRSTCHLEWSIWPREYLYNLYSYLVPSNIEGHLSIQSVSSLFFMNCWLRRTLYFMLFINITTLRQRSDNNHITIDTIRGYCTSTQKSIQSKDNYEGDQQLGHTVIYCTSAGDKKMKGYRTLPYPLIPSGFSLRNSRTRRNHWRGYSRGRARRASVARRAPYRSAKREMKISSFKI